MKPFLGLGRPIPWSSRTDEAVTRCPVGDRERETDNVIELLSDSPGIGAPEQNVALNA
jgi:hypothetical protein